MRAMLLLALLAAVIASAIAVVWARQQNRTLFMHLTKLQNQRDQLNVEFGRLELEQATWADPMRIESVARGKLDMAPPPPTSVRLIRP
ncbi:MAG TPA: cell division protein FtsL [Rhodanobacteraceae bacterium]|nr:cell division protein FtsL [Rhodanobacteraceae bacterium]